MVHPQKANVKDTGYLQEFATFYFVTTGSKDSHETRSSVNKYIC